MSIHSANNNPAISSSFQKKVEKTADQVKSLSNGLENALNSVKELSQELKNQQAVKTSGKEKETQLDTKTNQTLDQLQTQGDKQKNQVQHQSSAQKATTDPNRQMTIVAEIMAGLMQEEELDTNSDVNELKEKMALIMQKAEAFQDIELDDPDQNFELHQMFSNIEKFNQLTRRDAALDKQIADLEISLKAQDARDQLPPLTSENTVQNMKTGLNISFNSTDAPDNLESPMDSMDDATDASDNTALKSTE